MPKAKAAKISKYDRSVIETTALRPYVPADLRALFDHCLKLAAHSHKGGYAARAGRELLHARKLAVAPPAAAKSKRAEAWPYEIERVKLDRGGYDQSGRYYGAGKPLFVFRTPDHTGPDGRFASGEQTHFRASTVGEARKLAREAIRRYGPRAVSEVRQWSPGTSYSPLAHESESNRFGGGG